MSDTMCLPISRLTPWDCPYMQVCVPSLSPCAFPFHLQLRVSCHHSLAPCDCPYVLLVVKCVASMGSQSITVCIPIPPWLTPSELHSVPCLPCSVVPSIPEWICDGRVQSHLTWMHVAAVQKGKIIFNQDILADPLA